MGCAAILFWPRKRPKTLQYHLGKSDDHTVYKAEVAGVLLGLTLLSQLAPGTVQRTFIALDNQAAIRAARTPHTGPGQHLWKAVHQLLKAVQRRHPDIRVTLRWVPGHMDVEGNELADQHAKDAATGQSSNRTSLPKYLRKTLPRSAAKAKQMMKAQAKREAAETWKKSPRYAKLSAIDTTLPSAKYLQLTADIPRKHAALLMQLRMVE